ncbi:hypothetical protein GWP57_11540 [Gammaproteobacteria bacterium]|nr:hypothetical protein [Gammaproteobacteria bacterium]
MTQPYDKSAAVIVLPGISGGRLQDASLRSWLSRGSVSKRAQPAELLQRILGVLQLPYPESGLAALRMWGQTGDRPNVWIAAADPVYLEPRLDHLCLHALSDLSIPPGDLRGVFDHLQGTLAGDADYGFARIGKCGYLRSGEPIASASVPAYVVDGQPPNDFMPSGEGAAEYRNLLSEVEMALHEHEVNIYREAAGQAPINSLWFWGGGLAPDPVVEPLPPLFSGEPMSKGYWRSKSAEVADWPGSIERCLENSAAGFVAVPEFVVENVESVQQCLQELRGALSARRLSEVVLLFRDGVEARVRRGHSLRFWRRRSPLLD